ncbi:MAG: selenide, water dikinase SelD [Bryobacteraceae bacterium]|nr:selenide, water dikinase SelD [Bryobacteraceae bacterium]
MLSRIPRLTNANVLVGFDTSDDAGVYKLAPELALVQTVDFFTPIVDDPYTFGAIAAANALSDVYAMGGRPLSALSILAYPDGGDLDDLEAILRGGGDKLREAGCVLLGGHSVKDEEIKFGYAVTGTVHPDQVLTNAGARLGDELYLTKPLGTGIIATAHKRGLANETDVAAAIASMLTLNQGPLPEAHGVTDVTGFGLLGHAREMALASGVSLEIDWRAVEFLPGALDYSRAGAIPGGLKNNRDFAGCDVAVADDVPPEIAHLLYDPQTSGGLLVAGTSPVGRRIGRVVPKGEKAIWVK